MVTAKFAIAVKDPKDKEGTTQFCAYGLGDAYSYQKI